MNFINLIKTKMLSKFLLSSSLMMPVRSGEFHDYFIDSTAIAAAGTSTYRGKTDGTILTTEP